MFLSTDPSRHFCKTGENTIPIHRFTRKQFANKKNGLTDRAMAWAGTSKFTAATGQVCLVADDAGGLEQVLFGLGSGAGSGKPMAHGKLARILPAGSYELAATHYDPGLCELAWALGGYSFDRYRERKHETPQLVSKFEDQISHIAQAVFLTRDLINTPASDMGPQALEQAFRTLAEPHKAVVSTVSGDALLADNFPMVHAVGRASVQAPRVLNMQWGKPDDPKVTLVGKGVTFDTGGLNIKPGSSMALMKKDMGGAANVMGLAHMIMASKLPVRLRLIIGAVENAIAGNAFRPGDILPSRKGISVEIGNTDAEGRLVLGDCLAWGDEEKPQIMIDMATLTGAARVALGPDLPPFYTDDDAFAQALTSIAMELNDPVWRMPLWPPYQTMLSSKIADVNHITAGGFAGSVTAALFLSRFVDQAETWAHFDIFGWAPTERPWAPVGGEAQGIRALFQYLRDRVGVS